MQVRHNSINHFTACLQTGYNSCGIILCIQKGQRRVEIIVKYAAAPDVLIGRTIPLFIDGVIPEEPFHWEMDSVLSAKEGGSKKRFLTMTERTSRADLMFLMSDGTMASVVAVLDTLEKKLGSVNFRRIFQTITVDNGSEFQDWEGMTRAVDGEGDRTHIYYCHPYSAYERGSNENGNRMIRRKVPKGTDFTGITEDDTLRVQRWVNEYPRGILGGRCAGRVLMELAQEAGVEGVELLL